MEAFLLSTQKIVFIEKEGGNIKDGIVDFLTLQRNYYKLSLTELNSTDLKSCVLMHEMMGP